MVKRQKQQQQIKPLHCIRFVELRNEIPNLACGFLALGGAFEKTFPWSFQPREHQMPFSLVKLNTGLLK